MSFVSRLEARLRRFAIPNLTLVLIAGQALLFVLGRAPQGIHLENIALDPAKVWEGEVWRLLTFLFMPPDGPIIFAVFYFLLFHMFGTAVENHLGRFRYNLFFLVGYLANVAAAFAASAIVGMAIQRSGALAAGQVAAPNYFLYGTVFLAFARLYPDYMLYVFFVVPVKIRWLAWLTWASLAYAAFRGGWLTALLVLASVANYLIFFGPGHIRQARSVQRRRSFQAKATRAVQAPRHECRVCGLDSDESPKTLFRYCSKCAGQVCYCPAHIRDHEHVVDDTKPA